MRKKTGYLAAALLMMAAVLGGCSSQNGAKDTTPAVTAPAETPTATVAPSPTQTPAPTKAPEPTATPLPTATPTLTPSRPVTKNTVDFYEMRGMSPAELVAEMTVGWNLGNTMDARDGNGLASETSWGNPKTTQEIIDTVCAYGFNVLRVPTTWYNHVIDDNYTLDPEWLARVKEVVEYGLENGMYVILNAHHEDIWQKPDYERLEATKVQQAAFWKQIATYFADYGDHLIFEGMNEPRVTGSANEWNGGDAEGRDCINQLNQNFIDTVRATGGKNSTRLLLITTYAAASGTAAYKDYVFPEDANYAISLHAYTPYKFTFNTGDTTNTFQYKSAIQSEINSVMDGMVRFSQQANVPVIITECGAVIKKDKAGVWNQEEVGKWAVGYLSAAKKRHIPVVFWDNNSYKGSGENFGILNRRTLTWYYPEVVNAIAEVYYTETEEQ